MLFDNFSVKCFRTSHVVGQCRSSVMLRGRSLMEYPWTSSKLLTFLPAFPVSHARTHVSAHDYCNMCEENSSSVASSGSNGEKKTVGVLMLKDKCNRHSISVVQLLLGCVAPVTVLHRHSVSRTRATHVTSCKKTKFVCQIRVCFNQPQKMTTSK